MLPQKSQWANFDPYERSFRYVSTHILAGSLSEETVRDALRKGNAYVSHDWLCDPTGFAFVAQSRDGERLAVMGDEVALRTGLLLKAETPVPCNWKLIRNGEIVTSGKSRGIAFPVNQAGVYRVEAWLEADGEMRPWVYSNPIYVR